jgi:hypothetical protein
VKSLFVAIPFALMVFTAAASDRIAVTISVAADDAFKSDLSRSLSSEIRKLEQVDLTNADVNYQISVVAIRFEPNGPYVASVLVTSPLSNVEAHPVLKYAVIPVAHFVRAESKLQTLCASVATELDATVFEPDRRGLKAMERKFNDFDSRLKELEATERKTPTPTASPKRP